MAAQHDPIVAFKQVSVRFGSLVALDDVSLEISPGTIHCVLGENGAGKSTLMNVLFGLHRPSSGSLWFRGHKTGFRTSRDARRAGIGMVHQHFRLVPSLTVTENILLGREPTTMGFVSRSAGRAKVMALVERFGLGVDPDARIASLSVGQKQRVEILKALGGGAEVLILDEPTAVLTPQEIEGLFSVVRTLREQGRTILLVTHKVREVMQLADHMTVLRRGRLVATMPMAEVASANIAKLMVGRDVAAGLDRPLIVPGRAVLELDGLRVRSDRGEVAVAGATLSVAAGEIVAVAGVEGNGQTELVEAIAGLRASDAGSIAIAGTAVTRASASTRRQLGLAHIPEDRFDRGVAKSEPLVANMGALRMGAFRRHGVLDWTRLRQWAAEMISRYDIRASSAAVPIKTLSGGNIQKVILARELEEAPQLLLAAQPTRGLDVGATDYVHRALIAARGKGCAVLLVSADLDEVLRVADRILVILRGRIVSDMPAAMATRERIGLDMMGVGGDAVPAVALIEEQLA